jgi:phospholipase C
VRAQGQDEENPQNVQLGQAFVSQVVGAVINSPAWPRTLLVWLYDEHGGYYDHVPPPRAIAPDAIPPQLDKNDTPGGYDLYGVRVPAVVVSPWARPASVSSVVHDHTSVLAFVESKWNLPAMTYRDANARNMLDFFQLRGKRAPFADPPQVRRPLNPFVGPLPATSGSPGFHPIATGVPASSLPPSRFRLSAPPRGSENLS